ncbi:hypothetical protein D1007_46237 [Hordeum vulgare]|nr:hypothetical protein D1007_46237 [Hordeum vulgare]
MVMLMCMSEMRVRQEHPNFGIRAGYFWTEPDNRPNCMEQAQTNHPNQLIPEQAGLDNPSSTIEGGEVHDVSGEVHDVNGIFTKRTSIHSVGPGIVSPERRHEEPQNHDGHQAQVICSTKRINCITGRSTAPQTVNIEKRQLLTPDQTIQQAQKHPSCRAICTEKAHAEDSDVVIHVQEKQQQHVSQANQQSEPTECDPDWQHAGSPEQSLSDSPETDRIINNIKPSPSPHCEMHEPSSNDLDSPHLTTPPSNSHLNLSDPEQFARNYMPSEVRKALVELRSNSLFEHTMSQASSGKASLHDLTDSEEGDPLSLTLQDVGNLRLVLHSYYPLYVIVQN